MIEAEPNTEASLKRRCNINKNRQTGNIVIPFPLV